MKNTVYSVKGSNGIGKLNKTEVAIYEFMTSTEFLAVVQIGDSLSEKKLKNQFAKWNDEKMTVNVNSIVTEKTCRNVSKFFVANVKNGTLASSVIPVVSENRAHGTFSIDFKSVETLSNEYTDKELTEKKSKASKSAVEFILNYLNKHSEELSDEDIETIKNSLNAISSK